MATTKKTTKKTAAKPKLKVTASEAIELGPAHAPTTIDAASGRPVEKAPTEKDAPKVPGIRAIRTRPYLAGKIIAKHGLAAGVTDAMVAELDEAYGKPNAAESQFCLKNAHHAARGYLGIAEDAIE